MSCIIATTDYKWKYFEGKKLAKGIRFANFSHSNNFARTVYGDCFIRDYLVSINN